MPLRMIKKDRDEKARQQQARQQSGIAQKQETPKPQNLNSKGSEKANEPTSPSARRDERKAEQREQRIKLKEYGMKRGGLKGNQKKLDKNNNNRIDSEDFKILRGGRAAIKAKKGKLVPLKKDPTRPINPFAKKALDKGKKIIGKGGRIGAAATILGLAGAGAAKIGQTIGRKIDEAKKKNKKMGGGMMKKYSKGGDSKLQKGIEGTTFKPKKQTLGIFGDSEKFQKKYYDMTSAAKRDAHKKGRSEGKKFRGMTFVDRKTGTLRLDTVSNRKKYGKRVYKAPDVAYVEPIKYNKGGGADTGTMGEAKSKLATGIDAFKRRLKKEKLQGPKRGPMNPAKAMGGGMMMKPMGYKSGTSVKVKCKLGRNKPTKMY